MISPFREQERFFHLSAAAAHFGAGKPLVDLDQLFSLFFVFLLEDADKRAEAVIRYAHTEIEGLRQAFHVQVFDAHEIKGIGYLPGVFMVEFPPLIGHVLMLP